MSSKHPEPERLALDEASTVDLVREALDEAKELVRIEIQLATNEVQKEIRESKKAAVGFGVALVAAVLVLSLLAVALVFALGGTPGIAMIIAGVCLAIGAIAAGVGYTYLPKRLLGTTSDSVRADLTNLKEHVA